MLYSASSQSQTTPEIIHLECTGSEQWTSYWKKKPEEKSVSVDFVVNFSPKNRIITGATAYLARGCSMLSFVDSSKSVCDCVVNDQVVQCNSAAYDKDLKSVYKDEFSIDRITGKMITNRSLTFNGEIKSLEFGRIQCERVTQKF